jgi:hypothetical protein
MPDRPAGKLTSLQAWKLILWDAGRQEEKQIKALPFLCLWLSPNPQQRGCTRASHASLKYALLSRDKKRPVTIW